MIDLQPHPELQQKQHGQQIKGDYPVLLLCSGDIPPGAEHPALGCPAQEGH